MKDLSALRLYTRVARLGSFSAAARECGLSQPQASRIVADLEADLGARLLSRTTRAVVPTEAGAAFLARIEPLLVALDEAENDVREDGTFRGVLRMSMPTSFGIRTIVPRLAGFAERHPGLRIQIKLADMATPTSYNPLGAKGIGEAGTIGSTPAVQNAIIDALAHLGVRHIDMPASPQRVWQALRSAQAQS